MHSRVQFQFDTGTRRATHVRNVELAGGEEIGEVELHILPVDVEHRRVRGDPPVGPHGLHAAFEVPRVFLTVHLSAGRRRRVEPACLVPVRDRRIDGLAGLQVKRGRKLRRHVGEAFVGDRLLRGCDGRREKDVECRVLLLVIEAHTSRQVQRSASVTTPCPNSPTPTSSSSACGDVWTTGNGKKGDKNPAEKFRVAF